MKIIWGDKESNLTTLQRGLECVHPATDIVVLPETFSTGFPSGEDADVVKTMAESDSGETIGILKEMAGKYNVAICGSYISVSDEGLSNRAFFIEPSGDAYFARKRHLFTMAGENKVFKPGTERLQIRFRGWNIAMIICYDIRFPVWCRNRSNEYDLLLVIANWPSVRVKAWNRLIPARAIENLAYVAAVDCNGEDKKGFAYDGSSCVVDFKGDDISFKDKQDGLIYASLSKDRLEAFRTKFPAHLDADSFLII